MTRAQAARIPEYISQGLAFGLGTERIDRFRATQSIQRLYQAHKLKQVPVLYFDSPLAGMIVINLLSNLLDTQLGTQLSTQLEIQLWTKLNTQLGTQLSIQLRNQLGTQLNTQLWNQLRNQLRNQLSNQLWNQFSTQLWNQLKSISLKFKYNYISGSKELYWLYFYKFINDELQAVKTTAPLNETIDVCEQVGWFWPYENLCIVTEKPTEIHMSKERLHAEGKPALLYADGYALYALNGVLFDSELTRFVTDPISALNPKEILDIKNVEQRAEVIKRYGIQKLFFDLEPTLLDSKTEHGYELYEVSVYPGIPRKYLKMRNPSVDEVHIEAVHPDCKTVDEANAWANFGDSALGNAFNAPLILT